MPPKGGNSKKEAGRARKAENEAKKKDAAEADKERKEAATWEDGSRPSKVSKDDKRKADLARKQENARLLAEEEAGAPSTVKAAPKAGGSGAAKKAAAAKSAPSKPAGPGAIAAGGGLASVSDDHDKSVESYAATGLDDALDLLEIVNAKSDKASVGQQAADIEKHPERRYKAAFEAYVERELPSIKEEHPRMRLQQYKDLLHKKFQKSPDNPFNQVTVSYDASKDEKLEVLKAKRAQVEERLRDA